MSGGDLCTMCVYERSTLFHAKCFCRFACSTQRNSLRRAQSLWMFLFLSVCLYAHPSRINSSSANICTKNEFCAHNETRLLWNETSTGLMMAAGVVYALTDFRHVKLVLPISLSLSLSPFSFAHIGAPHLYGAFVLFDAWKLDDS